MMKREEAFKALARHIKDEDIVIATYSSAAEWNDLHPRVMNYFSMGAMGLASSHGLGLALGRPDKRIIVLDGDGSLLMNLGSLVTIAAVAPKNLIHFVSKNSCYEANGGHQIPNKDVDFTGLAKSAGYAHTFDFSDIRAFEQQVGHVLEQQGPVFGTLHVERTRQLTYDYPGLYAPEKRRAIKAELQKKAPR